MKKHYEEEAPPCAHMELLLHAAADGSSKGIKKWYAVAHASRCGQCGRFLSRLRKMIGTLHLAKKEDLPDGALDRLKQGKWREELKS